MPAIRRWPFVVLCVLVCPAATLVSWYCAMMATLLYGGVCGPRLPEIEGVGGILGIGGGLVAGAAWCWLMIHVAVRYIRRMGRSSPKLILWGTFAGHGAALLVTIPLHGGLMLTQGQWESSAVQPALIFAAASGLGLGLICGLLAWGAAALANPRRAAPLAGG